MPVRWYGDEELARRKQKVMSRLVRATETLRNEAIRLILQTPKTGRVYVRGNVTHIASAPGEPLASDTGNYLANIKSEYFPDKLEAVLHFGASYALYLEYGTAKMEPRPVVRPAVANKLGEMRTIMGGTK